MMFLSKYIYALPLALIALAACNGSHSPEEIVTEANIKALSSEQMLIQDKTSVLRLDMDSASGNALAARYKAGQGVKLESRRAIDVNGDAQETVIAIVFEDGHRLPLR